MHQSLAIIFCVVWIFPSESWLFDQKIGILSPTDHYVFVGELLNMTCRLFDSSVDKGDDSSKLYFTYGNDIPIPEEHTFIINISSKGFSLPVDSVFDKPYSCNIHNPVSQDGIFVDSTMVMAEYRPRPVTNFSCIIYNWDERMECSWDLGVNYFNMKSITTNLTLTYSAYSGECPKLQLLNCTWTKADGISFDRSRLSFKIYVTNTNFDVTNDTGWITIKQDDYVKPNPVEKLLIQSYSSTSVVLKWTHDRKHRSKYFIINLRSKWGDDKVVETTDTNMNITVPDLRPNTKYTISIVTRPGGKNKGYPSDPVEVSVTTEIDIPGKPPDVGNYFISYENCKANSRDVTVYWKELPEIELNSPSVDYLVEVAHTNESSTFYNVISQRYLLFEIPCIHDVVVSIWSKNTAGCSSMPSTIIIPKIKDLLPPSQVIVEAQNTSTDTAVTISWTPSGDSRIKCHTVYYCQYDTECTNDIDWSRVCGNVNMMTINNTKLQFDRKYRFGVSSDTDTISSGFKWQQCYYVKSNVPTPPLKVEVQAYPDDSLTVSWSEPECGQSPYIALYRIRWCTTEAPYKVCTGNRQEMNISSTKPSKQVISGLLAGTTYGVMVSHITADGRASAFSEMEYQQPTNSDLNEAELTGIIIGALFVFLMSIAGAVFIYRRASKNFRKFMKPLPIEKIEIPTSDKKITPANSTSSSESSNGDVSSTSKLIKNGNPKYYRQISKDSGRGSLSSDGLASPDITSRQDLFPVPEESTGNLEDSRKQTSDEKNKSQHPLPSNPDYSKVTHELGGHANSLFGQNDVIVASVLRRSCPNMNDKKFSGPDHHDGSSQKISSTSLASCKSSSEEKVWLDTECDNDGYMDEKEKSKSMEAVSSKDRRSTGGFDSYVLTGQVSEENSNVTEYSDMDSDGKNSFYVDESKVKSLSIEVNQSNDETESNSGYTDSCNINSRSQNNGPLLEIDEDSCISLISNGCYEDSDFNRSGRLISSPQQSPRSEPGSKSDVYHRLDSIENPQYHDLLTPLVSTNDSASCFGYVRNDILEVEPQRNLPAKENISSDNSDRLQNADAPSKSNSASANNGVIDNDGYLSDSGSIRSEKSSLFNCYDNPEDTSVVSPYITETELCEKFQETGSTEKDGTDGESDSDESDSLLNTPESTINGYVPHNFCQN